MVKPKQLVKCAIKIFLLVSGIFFFLVSVHKVIGKFIDHGTTISISNQPPQPLKPPAFTFCPAEGFDTIKMLDKFSMKSSAKFNDVDPNNEKIKNVSLVKVFMDSSYIIGSQLSITIGDPMVKELKGNSLKIGTNLIKTPKNDSYEIRIHEMFTYFRGLCYTIMMDKYMFPDSEEFILIYNEYLNFSSSPFPIEIKLASEVDRFNIIKGDNGMSSAIKLKEIRHLGIQFKDQLNHGHL
jgi:hypothetical protein